MIVYTGELAGTIASLKAAGDSAAVQSDLLKKISLLLESAAAKTATLEAATNAAHAIANLDRRAQAFRDKVFTAQFALRQDIDALETLLPKRLWPVPSYADMLFNF